MATLQSNVTELRGVGQAKAAALAKAGIVTLYDLVHHYPRAYQNRGDIRTIAEAADACRRDGDSPPGAFMLTIAAEPKFSMIRRGMTILKFKAFDETGMCELTYFNQTYLRDVFHAGMTFRFWGRPSFEVNRLCMSSPVFEKYDGEALMPIVPVYPLTAGITQKFMFMLVREAIKAAIVNVSDHIPTEVLRENDLCSLSYAIRNIHFPPDTEALEKARRRFAFDEIFTLAAAMASMKKSKAAGDAPVCPNTDISPLLSLLSYDMTGAQKRSVDEILSDMSGDHPMSRILCGDVGSGKTAVAAAAAFAAVNNGWQCALMVPTEILAKQHYMSLFPVFEKLGMGTALLCGSMSASDKKEVKTALESGKIQFVIGTHALLTDDVKFARLGLVITDEQHRFGVNQRAALREKSRNVHSLVMSATPIPRTLSLVVYGDLDVSRLDEMPAGRQKIGTFRVDESYRERLFGFIRKQKGEGHRTYVVCPSIEESKKKQTEDAEELCDISFFGMPDDEEKLPLKAAVKFAGEISEKMPDLKVGCIHGKMKTAEKDAVMAEFSSGQLDVLVSTTVIEVGVNVPEATLMVVENAERFGLSQLHQLRGRVGRGDAKSYCILVTETKNEKSLERIDVLCRMSDGFAVAEEDLRLRGPGDFFASDNGMRQHGGADMPFSSGCNDEVLISAAVSSAAKICSTDPELRELGHRVLADIIYKIKEKTENTIS